MELALDNESASLFQANQFDAHPNRLLKYTRNRYRWIWD